MKTNTNELYKSLKISENKLHTIVFDNIEQKIFDLLLNVANSLPEHPIIRVVGGFVRDKLLGRNNKDIDIALDTITGAKFANAVVDHMRSNGKDIKNIGIIKQATEQSKHLEVATTFIYGLPIDFVNLRTETYANSRIPEIKIGTPEEDAFRRDATINALFYNINENKIEDFTGKGIEDLKNGIIRTPLDPLQTFTEDPLRAIRAIRFASRYDFKIDSTLIEAAKNPKVKEALQNKISRERIANELRGILRGPNPAQALEFIKIFDLRDEVFPRPNNLREWDMEQDNHHHELTLYDHLVEVVRSLNVLIKKPGYEISSDDKITLLFAAFFHDIGKFEPSIHGLKQLNDRIVSTYYGYKAHSHRIAQYIMKELKMSNDEINGILRLIEPAGHIENLIRSMQQGEQPTRQSLGRFVQKFGDSWKHAVYLDMADEISKKRSGPELEEAKITTHYKLINMIENDQSISNAHKTKSLLDGTEISTLMNIRPGAAIGVIKNVLNDWQLSNPNASKNDAINFIKLEFNGKI